MNSILVTGASGFIGRHCLPQLLLRGFTVHAVTSRPVPPATDSVVWHRADLWDSRQVDSLCECIRPTHLLHLAWVTDPGAYRDSFENRTWLSASTALIDSFQRWGGRRVLVAGTCAEYAWRTQRLHETLSPLRPRSLYARCKHELMVWLSTFAARKPLSWAWARVFFLYGPGAHLERMPGIVIDSLLREKVVCCSAGTQLLDYIYVEDAAHALAQVAGGQAEGPINIATGTGVAVRELVEQVVTQIGGGQHVRFAAHDHQAPDVIADASRLMDEIGWTPQFTLEAGLAASIEHVRQAQRVAA